MSDKHAPQGQGPDSLLVSTSMDELRAPTAFRAFGFILVAVVLSAFVLMLGITLAVKGGADWSLAYVRPSTWLFMALCAPLAAPLTNRYLGRRTSTQPTHSERASMTVVTRSVSVCFFVIGLIAIANT